MVAMRLRGQPWFLEDAPGPAFPTLLDWRLWQGCIPIGCGITRNSIGERGAGSRIDSDGHLFVTLFVKDNCLLASLALLAHHRQLLGTNLSRQRGHELLGPRAAERIHRL